MRPEREVEEALARASAYVRAHGTRLDALRLECLLGPHGRAEWLAALAALQHADGGFDAALQGGSGGPSGVEATARVLGWLAGLRLLREPVALATVAFLAAAQREDGGWATEAAGELPPQDAVAGSALVAGLLARASSAPPRALAAASRFLARAWSPERVRSGDLAAITGFACYYAFAPDERSDEALQWCGRELERGLRTGTIDALQVARVLALCDAMALPGARIPPAELRASLLASQAADGGFRPRAPIPARVAATLDAVAALRRLAAA